jgi:hypothetical protein
LINPERNAGQRHWIVLFLLPWSGWRSWGVTLGFTSRLDQLDEHLVFLDHAKVIAGTFFNGFNTFGQTSHIPFQLLIAKPQPFIDLLLLIQLPLQITDSQHSAFAKPQGVLKQKQQGKENEGDQPGVHIQESPAEAGPPLIGAD